MRGGKDDKMEPDKFLYIEEIKNAPPAAIFRDGLTGELFKINLASLEVRVENLGSGGESERALDELRKHVRVYKN